MLEKPKFLIVDDIEENLVALEALLRADDREIYKAHSGSEALEQVLANDFALALLDIQMPGMDGFELAELMRGMERSSRIPIIFVTAGASEPLRAFRGYESGAVDVLFKPINPEILRQKAEIFYQLHMQRQQLAQAVRIREDVLAMVTHDLRTPLAVIHASTTVFLNPRYQPTPEQAREQHQRVLRNVDLMNRMIGDLTDMVNLRSGRLSIQRRPEPMHPLIRESVAAHERGARDKGLSLDYVPAATDIQLNCDRARLVQVFSNLLGNAVKFCKAGDSIRVRSEARNGLAQFEVCDSGPGIAPDDLPHIFDPYWSAREHKSAGTGLGLYIAKGIVEAHGGRIRAESRVGSGATFFVTLPAQ
ncbi:MAG TPA: hybrid sensor histidine kinase/response regulator [Steroidobacteraceae bacterium]|jgi:signal transduction histidine kinase